MSATPIADMVEKMISGGIPPEFIVLAVRTAETAGKPADSAADKRRAWDRERKRNNKIPPENSTGKPPPTYTTPPSKKETKGSSNLSMRACQLPADFVLTEADVDFATSRGWDQSKVESEYERFCDHALAGGRKQVDWHAAWRKWVTSPYQTSNGASNGNGHRQKRRSSDIAKELADELRAKEREAGIGRQADWLGSD